MEETETIYTYNLEAVTVINGASLVAQWLKKKKNPPVNAGDGLILGLERFPGRQNGNPFQHSCLRNPLDRGAWRAIVHGVTESDQTEQLSNNNNGDNVIYFANLCSSCFSPLF